MNTRIRAGDAKAWKSCRRRAWYDHQLDGEPLLEVEPFDQLVQIAGEEHEAAVKEELAIKGEMVEARSANHTRELMAAGVPVIYQPVAIDPNQNLVGRPDFLLKTPGGEYQVADAKLASSLKSRPDIRIQLGVYRRLFPSRQPAIAFLGDGSQVEVADEADASVDQFLHEMQTLLAEETPPSAQFGYTKCMGCPYREICVPEFEKNQALSLLYELDPRSVPGLEAQGIRRIDQLAAANASELEDVPYLNGIEKKERIILRAHCYLTRRWRLICPLDLPSGTWVHFDVETDPLSELGSQVYLWGFLEPPYNQQEFVWIWSDSEEDSDYQAWLGFLDLVAKYRQSFPDLVLAHYGQFEVTQIKTYAARYKMLDHPLVSWLLGGESPLFDLLSQVKRCLILPLKSYGLKAVCKSPDLVNFQWELEESGSQWSVVRYYDYLNAGTDGAKRSIQREILSYNRDDVRATRALELWLRELS